MKLSEHSNEQPKSELDAREQFRREEQERHERRAYAAEKAKLEAIPYKERAAQMAEALDTSKARKEDIEASQWLLTLVGKARFEVDVAGMRDILRKADNAERLLKDIIGHDGNG